MEEAHHEREQSDEDESESPACAVADVLHRHTSRDGKRHSPKIETEVGMSDDEIIEFPHIVADKPTEKQWEKHDDDQLLHDGERCRDESDVLHMLQHRKDCRNGECAQQA